MIRVNFSVSGKPVPAPRLTKRSLWVRGKKYFEYIRRVQLEFVEAVKIYYPLYTKALQNIASKLKPLAGIVVKSCSLAISVYYLDRKVADLDNVLKTILDALFDDDKCVNEIHIRRVAGAKDAVAISMELEIFLDER